MTKQQLLDMGLSEEQATKVLAAHKTTIDGEYIPKFRLDEVTTAKTQLEKDLKDRDKQLKDLSAFEGDNKALKEQVEKLEAENKVKDKAYNETIALERKKTALKLDLIADADGRPHDVDMVMGLFDLAKINIDETTGKITSGYKEQNEALRKEKSFLYAPKQDGKPPVVGFKPAGTPPADGSQTPPADESVSYGKSLASQRLGMMGITPAAAGTQK